MLSIILMTGLNVQCYNDIATVADPPRGTQEPKQAVLSMEKQIADSDWYFPGLLSLSPCQKDLK